MHGEKKGKIVYAGKNLSDGIVSVAGAAAISGAGRFARALDPPLLLSAARAAARVCGVTFAAGGAGEAVHAISPVPWKLVETSEGWTVETGEARLVVTNGRRPRVFKTLEAAVRQLRDRVGVTNFQVQTVRT